MSQISKWCDVKTEDVNGHQLSSLTVRTAKVPIGVDAVAKGVPLHYTSKKRIAGLLKRLGKAKAALYVENKLPLSKSLRSGDLGEILGSGYVAEFTSYSGINRLRWKDHREMAMRGDDIIGVRADPNLRVAFLKGEVKSSVAMSNSTVAKARQALKSHQNRPSPHALTFLADRLHGAGDNALADLIDDAQLSEQIKLGQITHLMFVFAGNDPSSFLRKDLNAYAGTVSQMSVGLRVADHQAFIKSVFEKVVANGNKP